MQLSDNKQMFPCSRDPSHLYANDLASCPFCASEPAVQKPLPPPVPSRHWVSEREDPVLSPQAQLRNIFPVKLHLGVLARLKVLILLTFVIVVGCWQAFARSFHESVFGWPLLQPQPSYPAFILLIIMSWLLVVGCIDKGEAEEGRVAWIEWFFAVALFLPLLGLWLISPIIPSSGGIPEKRGSEYVLRRYSSSKGSGSYSRTVRYISKEEHDLLTRYLVRRHAFGWMIFHAVLMVYFLFWHYKVSRGDLRAIEQLDPHQLNIPQTILALRLAPHNSRMWLQLGWMLEREGETEYARNCYQRALLLNLSKQPTAAAATTSWLNSLRASLSASRANASTLWTKNNSISCLILKEYKSGVSLFSLLRLLFSWPISVSLLLMVPLSTLFLISYPEGPLGALLLLVFRAVVGMFIIRFLAGMLLFLKVYLTSRSWPTTEAMVIGSFLRKYTHKNREYYEVHFVVVYQVGDKILYSTVPSINAYDPLIRDESIETAASIESARILQDERYRFGKSTPVFYNPSRPDIILSQAGFNSSHITAVLPMIVMASFLALFWHLVR